MPGRRQRPQKRNGGPRAAPGQRSGARGPALLDDRNRFDRHRWSGAATEKGAQQIGRGPNTSTRGAVPSAVYTPRRASAQRGRPIRRPDRRPAGRRHQPTSYRARRQASRGVASSAPRTVGTDRTLRVGPPRPERYRLQQARHRRRPDERKHSGSHARRWDCGSSISRPAEVDRRWPRRASTEHIATTLLAVWTPASPPFVATVLIAGNQDGGYERHCRLSMPC